MAISPHDRRAGFSKSLFFWVIFDDFWYWASSVKRNRVFVSKKSFIFFDRYIKAKTVKFDSNLSQNRFMPFTIYLFREKKAVFFLFFHFFLLVFKAFKEGTYEKVGLFRSWKFQNISKIMKKSKHWFLTMPLLELYKIVRILSCRIGL